MLFANSLENEGYLLSYYYPKVIFGKCGCKRDFLLFH